VTERHRKKVLYSGLHSDILKVYIIYSEKCARLKYELSLNTYTYMYKIERRLLFSLAREHNTLQKVIKCKHD